MQRLSRGEAIARFERSDNDCNLITFPPPEEPSEDERMRRTNELLALSQKRYGVQGEEPTPKPALSNVPDTDTPNKLDDAGEDEPNKTHEQSNDATPNIQTLTPDETRFLHFVGTTDELMPLREVYRRAKLSADKGTRLKKKLVEVGHLVEVKVPLKAKGRAATLLVLSPPGREAIGLPHLSGKGGPVHQHLQRLVATQAEHAGWHSRIEGFGTNGKLVDVALEKDGQRVAIEISVTTRAEHEFENIRGAITGGFGTVITLCVSPTTRDKLDALLHEHDQSSSQTHIRTGLIKDFAAIMKEVLSS